MYGGNFTRLESTEIHRNCWWAGGAKRLLDHMYRNSCFSMDTFPHTFPLSVFFYMYLPILMHLSRSYAIVCLCMSIRVYVHALLLLSAWTQ